jgi:hypothetical protein
VATAASTVVFPANPAAVMKYTAIWLRSRMVVRFALYSVWRSSFSTRWPRMQHVALGTLGGLSLRSSLSAHTPPSSVPRDWAMHVSGGGRWRAIRVLRHMTTLFPHHITFGYTLCVRPQLTDTCSLTHLGLPQYPSIALPCFCHLHHFHPCHVHVGARAPLQTARMPAAPS